MARPLRIEFPGAVYHLTARGNARQPIFHDHVDRELFLARLARVVTRWRWRCQAYCLTDNHFHLLIETELPTLSRGMHALNGVYAQRFNRRHDRVGHVFQSRFSAVLVERETHLLNVTRYVVLNPCRAGLCADPGAWPYSSYAATAGLAAQPPFLAVDDVLACFGRERRGAEQAFRAFVAAGCEKSPWQLTRARIFLGSEDFVRRVSDDRPAGSKEVPRAQRQPLRPSIQDLLIAHGERGFLVAYRDYGYPMREIAGATGVHYSTVSRWLRVLEKEEDRTCQEGGLPECKT